MGLRTVCALAAPLFCVASGHAADGVELLVADIATSDIRRFDASTGAFLGRLGQHAGLLGSGQFAAGPDGSLYVAHFEFARVLRLDGRTGGVLDSADLSGRPLYPRFGPDGYLYFNITTESANILRYDPATLEPVGTLPVENHQGDFQFGLDGNLYVTNRDDHAIDVFDMRTGQYVDWDPSTPLRDPFARFPGPLVAERIAFGPDGDLFALGSRSIVRWDGQTGAYLGEVLPAPPIGERYPVSLAFAPDGHLYVGDTNGRTGDTGGRILRYSADGQFLGVVVDGPDLSRPAGMVFVPEPSAIGAVVAGLPVMFLRRR